MSTFMAKSTSGRTEWQLLDGRLKETGPDSFTFTLTATDTFALLNLLLKGKNEVLAAAQKERTVSQQDMVRVNSDGELFESGPQTGATSSIEIEKDVRGQGMPIKPSRGA